MKVSGNATLQAPVERVYAALNDPGVLVRTIPGCERLEQVGDDSYRMTLSAGVASIKGSYAGDVRITDQREPNSFVLKATGAGAPGTVSADVVVRLEPGDNGCTVLSYDADAIVGGMIGGVGQRILAGVAKRTAGDFFSAVDDVLNGAAPAGTATPEAPTRSTVDGRAPGETLDGVAGSAGVYVRPAAPSRNGGLLPGGEFAAGAVFGAAVGLLGTLVGGLVATRAARTRR